MTTEEEFYERLEAQARASLIEWGDRVESCQDFKMDPHGPYMDFTFRVDGEKLPYNGFLPITVATLKEIFCDD